MIPSGTMPAATVNPYPLSGILTRSGTEYELWCPNGLGYWWVTFDAEYGPFPTEDAAFEADLP